MQRHTNQEMVDLLLIYGLPLCDGREALRLYKKKYPSRHAPEKSIFYAVLIRLYELGAFADYKKEYGRNRTTTVEKVEQNPTTSIRMVSRKVIFYKLPWDEIMHDEKLHL